MNQYIVVLPISPFKIGPYTGKSSLHCTLFHWFRLSSHMSESDMLPVLQQLRTMLCLNETVLVSRAPALYGPNSDIPVHVLEYNPTLHHAHQHLLEYLRHQECELPREDWIGECYSPHVTSSNGKVFATGTRHIVSSVAMLCKDEDGKKLVVQIIT